jgi:hypothetical protein
MDYVHHCAFCGWGRVSGSATILEPHCERCGCALRSATAAELEASLGSESPSPDRTADRSGARLVAPVSRIAVSIFVMVAAAHAGYAEGGPAIGVAAFGAAGLLTVPVLVPAGRR